MRLKMQFFFLPRCTANAAHGTPPYSISMHLARSNGAFALLIREASRSREKVELLKTGTSLGARLNILTAIPRLVNRCWRRSPVTRHERKTVGKREREGGKGLIMAGRRAQIEEKHADRERRRSLLVKLRDNAVVVH